VTLLVCGGRSFQNYGWLEPAIASFKPTRIVQGGADGADAIARAWATRMGVACVTFHADWYTHGKAAGPIRNQRMLDEAKPDAVLAAPGGAGTMDMVARAMAAGVPCFDLADMQQP
jgi:hypothetical protein